MDEGAGESTTGTPTSAGSPASYRVFSNLVLVLVLVVVEKGSSSSRSCSAGPALSGKPELHDDVFAFALAFFCLFDDAGPPLPSNLSSSSYSSSVTRLMLASNLATRFAVRAQPRVSSLSPGWGPWLDSLPRSRAGAAVAAVHVVNCALAVVFIFPTSTWKNSLNLNG